MTWQQPDDGLHRIRSLVATHGHAIQGVFPRAGDPGVPFAYTVGLTPAGHPELIVAALDFATMQQILNILAAPDTRRRAPRARQFPR